MGGLRGGEDGHLAADEVFARARRGLPELSRATVYNTFAVFVEAGMLQVVESRGAVLYDPDHHHFRCRSCDRLYDVPVEGVEGLRISGASEFVVDQTTVLLRGLCPLCSTASPRWPWAPAFSRPNSKVKWRTRSERPGGS